MATPVLRIATGCAAVLTAFAAPSHAELQVDWYATYGFEAPRPDTGRAVVTDPAGNIYVTGESAVAVQEHDYVTIKYDAAGTMQWLRHYNGLGDFNDEAKAIGLDADGNVYVCGISWGGGNFGTPPKYDLVTIKYTSDGEMVYVHRFNSVHDNDDLFSDFKVMPDGSVYVFGFSYGPIGQPADADYLTYKLDPAGEVDWWQFYDGPEDDIDWLSGAMAADESGVTIAASVEVWTGQDDMSIYGAVRYDPGGTVVWENEWMPPVPPFGIPDFNIIFDAVIDPFGNFIVAGRADDGTSSDSPSDAYLVKFGPSGQVLWSVANQTERTDEFERLTTDAQGNVFAVGAFNVEEDAYLHANHLTAAYDANGGFLWEHRFAGDGPWFDGEGYVTINSRGELVVATRNIMAATGEDMKVFIYDRLSGSILDSISFDGSCCDWVRGLALDTDDNIVLAGSMRPDGTNKELAVVRISGGGDVDVPGDVDGDGVVSVTDLVALIQAWGVCDGVCPADLNGDGRVNVADLVILVTNWT